MEHGLMCDVCGADIEALEEREDMPKGLGLMLRGGRMVNVCRDCVMKIGGEQEFGEGDTLKRIEELAEGKHEH